MAADVEVAAQLALAVEHHDHRQAAHLGGEEAARARRARRCARRTATSAGRCCSRSAAATAGSTYQLYGRRLDAGLDQRAVHGRGILPKSICESKFRGLRARRRSGRSRAGLDILELFAGESPELTQKEISERLGLPVPTVHRLTKLLVERGWLVRDPGSRRLRLGLGVARLLPALLSGLRLPELARDHLRGMAERTGETVNLAVLHGGEVVYLRERERQPPAHPALHDRPAAAGALHRARQVPARPAARRGGAPARPAAEPYAALTPRTITTWKELRASLEQVRRRRRRACRTRSTRWASTRSRCRSPGSEGDGPAAVNVSLPSSRAVGSAGAELTRELRAVARAIEADAGIHGRAGAAA